MLYIEHMWSTAVYLVNVYTQIKNVYAMTVWWDRKHTTRGPSDIWSSDARCVRLKPRRSTSTTWKCEKEKREPAETHRCDDVARSTQYVGSRRLAIRERHDFHSHHHTHDIVGEIEIVLSVRLLCSISICVYDFHSRNEHSFRSKIATETNIYICIYINDSNAIDCKIHSNIEIIF